MALNSKCRLCLFPREEVSLGLRLLSFIELVLFKITFTKDHECVVTNKRLDSSSSVTEPMLIVIIKLKNITAT